MFYLVGLMGLAFVALGIIGATLAGRALAFRALRLGGAASEAARDSDAYFRASRTRRIASLVAGPLAAYAFCALLVLVALLGGGKSVPTTAVVPMQGGRAEAAGVHAGDGIVAIDGRAVADWEELRARLRAARDAEIELEIERDGERSRLRVRPDDGKIGVQPVTREASVPIDAAIGEAVTKPASVVIELAKALLHRATGRETAHLAGPVGITRAAADSSRRFGAYVSLLGIFAAYVWPGSWVIAFALRPRRRATNARIEIAPP